MAKIVETIGTDETIALFRSYGVPMSFETLTALIDGGKVPWAISARKGGNGNYLRKIFKKPLVEWLEAMAVEAPQ